MKIKVKALLASCYCIAVLTWTTPIPATSAPSNGYSVENKANGSFRSILVEGSHMSMDHMKQPLILAQWGFWTHCQVYLANGIQIAVVNAISFRACMSAGPKCANGRSYTNIIHKTNPFLQDSDQIEKCEISS